MNVLRILCAILGIAVAVDTHALGSHGSQWWDAKGASVGSVEQGSWSVELQEGRGLWASTKGDRGALGQYCGNDKACAWLIIMWDASCAEGGQHPVLLNTDRAASHHVIQCIGTMPGLGSAFAFTDFDRVDLAIRGAEMAGIAIPEQSDAIGVAHFKLDGAAAAIDSMRARIVAQANTE